MKRKLFVFCIILTFVLLASAFAHAEYNEAPMLEKLVNEGELPPVEERLPDEPVVVEPEEEIGKYGGTFNFFMYGPDDTPGVSHYCTSSGGWAIRDPEQIVEKGWEYGYDLGPLDAVEWNEERTELTLHILEGVKWSDGHPFTADDFLFHYEDIIHNKNFHAEVPDDWKSGGEPLKMEKIDDYTIKITGAAPFPLIFRKPLTLPPPKHYVKEYHPDYNPDATVEKYEEADHIFNPERPRLSPWIVESYSPDDGARGIRNPYFYKVDPEGNQLPYIDKTHLPVVQDTEAAILKVISGEVDAGLRHIQHFENYPLLVDNEEKGDYKILLWHGSQFTKAQLVNLNPYPTHDERMAKYLSDRRFRIALSLAVDRDELNDILYFGQARTASHNLSSSSPHWNDEFAKLAEMYAEYDPERAKQILDELGLKDRNGNGVRQFPDGDPVEFVYIDAVEMQAHVRHGELVVEYWNEIGLDVHHDLMRRGPLLDRLWGSGEYYASTWATDGEILPAWWSHEGPFSPAGVHHVYHGGNYPEGALPEAYYEVFDLQDQYFEETDPEKRTEILLEITRIRRKEVMHFGTLADTPIMMVRHNRMGNIPDKSVVITEVTQNPMYQWFIKD